MKEWLRFVRSVKNAAEGIAYTVKTQRNMQIHVVIAVLVLLASWWLRIPRGDVLLVFFSIALVFALELVNTAVEATIDLVTRERHPLAKAAKDASAGAVLIAACLSVIIGIAVFAQPLWEKLTG